MPSHLARIAERFNASHDFDFTKHCVLLARIGSDSHGTSIPSTNGGIDDVDYFAVVLPPARYLLGLDTYEGWSDQWEELDVVVYSFHKFVRLLTKANPNVLGTLWLRDEDYVMYTWPFEELKDHRHLFATKRAHASFAGYAQGQMKDMTAYSPEIQREIEVLEALVTSFGWPVQDIMDRRPLRMPFNVTPEWANEKAERLRYLRGKYHAAYMGEKRRNLVKLHGYDTKNAAHLIRLLLMCGEFLQTGEMQVYRPDREMLKEIKRGHWTLERVKAYADELFENIKRLRDESPLPEEANIQEVNDLVTRTVLDEMFYGSMNRGT